MVLTREDAEKRIQKLLNIAKEAMNRVTELAITHGIEPSFMGLTFHQHREMHGEILELRNPGWYEDEYWRSSSGYCNIDVVYYDEKEEEGSD